jgi:dipeptidyl aminopeptidase/acylaminoacyl peptidase
MLGPCYQQTMKSACLVTVAAAIAIGAGPTIAAPTTSAKTVRGNRTVIGIPELSPALLETLARYQNTRGAAVVGFTKNGCVLVLTRFAETNQVHRVCRALGMREQLTFYNEPIGFAAVAPAASKLDGFVFGKDEGGNEFSQLYWFDLQTRAVTRITDGKRSQNLNPVWSADGGKLAYSSTARNGVDTDIWVYDFQTHTSEAAVTVGGSLAPRDFSPDGKSLIFVKSVSIAEVYPGEVDLATKKVAMYPIDGGKAAFGGFAYASPTSAYFVSDEPLAGKPSEYLSLRKHDMVSNKISAVSGVGNASTWDVASFTLSANRKRLAYVTNEDGYSKLRVVEVPSHREVKLPTLPAGVFSAGAFSNDGSKLAISINSSTAPSDVYVIDFGKRNAERWTQSEVGGLDAATFVEPTLIHYPTFDTVDGKLRLIPAFYYRPKNVAANVKLPVIINIHGGPESQTTPVFSATIQYLAVDKQVAIISPNVRGSSGYGKTFLTLDNAEKREDSVRDIGALLDWIGKQTELDSKRIGVMGGSYGGYMVLASLTNFGERIAAGIDVVGISHFGTFLKNTEAYRQDLRRVEYGDERDPTMAALFEKISPLRNASKIRARLFVAQGKNDPRVPWTEAEQIVDAVSKTGASPWYLLFDDEGHGFRKKANIDYFTAASIVFWQQTLLDKK